ncbi:MAG TPA: beta-propeller fold lactonase family protein [bacterium]|nr:beta-propeller fold lactonase family protein [bacterium]
MVLKNSKMKAARILLIASAIVVFLMGCSNPLVSSVIVARNAAVWSKVIALPATEVAANHSVTLSWADTPDATSYNLYWSTSPNPTKASATKIEGVTSPYVHSGLSNKINYYYFITAVSADTESGSSAVITAMPMQLVAYINSVGGVKIYPVDQSTGILGTPADVPGTGYNLAFTVDPACKYAYLTDHTTTPGKVWSFSIDPNTGSLTPFGVSAQCGSQPGFIVVNSNSSFVYVGNDLNGDSSISGFKVNADGSLSALSGFPLIIGDQINGLSISPDRRFLYASTLGKQLYGYMIDTSTGGLTAISGSPKSTTYTPGNMAFDPSSGYLYSANMSGEQQYVDLYSYTLNAITGVFAAEVLNKINWLGTVTYPFNYCMAMDARGRFLFVGNRTDPYPTPDENSITVFKVDAGALSIVKVGTKDSMMVPYYPLSMAVDTLGNCLYVANGNFVESYSINQTTGALSWLATTDNGSHVWDMTIVSLP